MRTETAVQTYWEVSLAWRGFRVPEGTTIETLFKKMAPLYEHTSSKLVSQVDELGSMIVRMKTKRKGKQKDNVIQLPIIPRRVAA